MTVIFSPALNVNLSTNWNRPTEAQKSIFVSFWGDFMNKVMTQNWVHLHSQVSIKEVFSLKIVWDLRLKVLKTQSSELDTNLTIT